MSEKQQPTSIRIEVLDKISGLATAGLGLVAALAWNDAIKSIFDTYFPKTSGIIAQFVYAIILTTFIVFVTIKLGRLTNIAKKQLAKDNDLDKR
jgi:hypothetical protein